MNTTEYIKQALQSSAGWALGLINDMQDAPLAQPTSNGGNHALWVLGHLAFSESQLLDKFILGNENRFPELESLYAAGSTPTTDASAQPSFGELMEKFQLIRAATLEHLGTLSEDDLDKPSHAPGEWGAFFSTIGACFTAMCHHAVFHAGQVADARRANGRPVLMV